MASSLSNPMADSQSSSYPTYKQHLTESLIPSLLNTFPCLLESHFFSSPSTPLSHFYSVSFAWNSEYLGIPGLLDLFTVKTHSLLVISTLCQQLQNLHTQTRLFPTPDLYTTRLTSLLGYLMSISELAFAKPNSWLFPKTCPSQSLPNPS